MPDSIGYPEVLLETAMSKIQEGMFRLVEAEKIINHYKELKCKEAYLKAQFPEEKITRRDDGQNGGDGGQDLSRPQMTQDQSGLYPGQVGHEAQKDGNCLE